MSKKDKVLQNILIKVRDQNPDTLNYVIPNLFTKKLKSYMLIREDLNHIHYLTETLITLKSDAIQDEKLNTGIWYSVIIIYGKCFTSNNGGMSKLEKSLFDTAPKGLMETSEHLLDLRNSFVAHRDDTEKEQALVFLKIRKGEQLTDEAQYQISSARMPSPSIEVLEMYLALFSYLIDEVEKKIQKQTQKAHEVFFSHFTAEQAQFFLINNMKE